MYVRIGGHSYGTVYPGPIGTILEPQKAGLNVHGELTQASTLCGACSEVCPVRIPIPSIINRLRYDAVRKDQESSTIGAGSRRTLSEAATWKAWSWAATHPALYHAGSNIATRFKGMIPSNLGAWTSVRTAPVIAESTLHNRLKLLGVADE